MTELTADLWVRIVDNSPDGILVCDPQGTIRYWNRGAERIFGFPRAKVIGASLDLIIPERLRARHWAGWHAAMSTGTTRYAHGQLLSVPAVHVQGRQLSIEFSIQLLKGPNGAIEWIVAIIRDVTERYTREKQLRAELSRSTPTGLKRGTDMMQNTSSGEAARHEFIKGVHGVRYQVEDVARSVEFYTQHLGFQLKHQQLPAFANVSLGDTQILLSGPGASGSRPMPDGRLQEPGGWNRVVLKVVDLPGLISELKKAGLRFRNELETGPGGRQIQLEDPDGNPIELFEPAR